jgi:hypothetical protein
MSNDARAISEEMRVMIEVKRQAALTKLASKSAINKPDFTASRRSAMPLQTVREAAMQKEENKGEAKSSSSRGHHVVRQTSHGTNNAVAAAHDDRDDKHSTVCNDDASDEGDRRHVGRALTILNRLNMTTEPFGTSVLNALGELEMEKHVRQTGYVDLDIIAHVHNLNVHTLHTAYRRLKHTLEISARSPPLANRFDLNGMRRRIDEAFDCAVQAEEAETKKMMPPDVAEPWTT